jgi:hypothetical protein
MTDDTRRAADCERANRLAELALENALDDQAADWLHAHRQICRDCATVAEAMEYEGPLWRALDSASEVDDVPALDADRMILAHLQGAPVAALPIENGPRSILASLSIALVVLLPILTGLRGDLTAQPWTLIGLPVVLLVAAFLAALLAFDHLERRSFTLIGAIALAIAPITLITMSLIVEPVAGSKIPNAFLGPAISCSGLGLIVALLVLVPVVVIARRSMAGPTQLGAVLMGATTAALGIAVLQLHCGNVDLAHLLVGHGAILLVIPVVALLLRASRRLA